MAQQHCIQTRPLYLTLFERKHSRLNQHRHLQYNRTLTPATEEAIRICLRAMGGFALAACLLFWLHLLMN